MELETCENILMENLQSKLKPVSANETYRSMDRPEDNKPMEYYDESKDIRVRDEEIRQQAPTKISREWANLVDREESETRESMPDKAP